MIVSYAPEYDDNVAIAINFFSSIYLKWQWKTAFAGSHNGGQYGASNEEYRRIFTKALYL
jgi:hypothetical protein